MRAVLSETHHLATVNSSQLKNKKAMTLMMRKMTKNLEKKKLIARIMNMKVLLSFRSTYTMLHPPIQTGNTKKLELLDSQLTLKAIVTKK
jgi:hypothetical protein